MKHLEIIIAVKFFKRIDKLFQHFIPITGKRNIHYLFDKQLIIGNEFDDAILKNALQNQIMLSKEEREDRVVIEYEINNPSNLKNYYITIIGDIPSNKGCLYCRYRKQIDRDSFECKAYKKIFTKNKKRCILFKQKVKIIT